MRHPETLVLVIAALTLLAPRAEAQQPAETEEQSLVRLARLQALLQHDNDSFQEYRLWGGLGFSAAGVLTLPMGIAIRHHDEGRVGGVIAIGVGAGELAGGIALLAGGSGSARSPSDLYELLQERRRAGTPPARIVAEIEDAWRRSAEAAQASRRLAGGVGVGLGVLCIGAGSYLEVQRVSGLSASERFGYAAAFLGVGGMSLILGMRSLFIEDTVEVGWRSYHEQGAGMRVRLSDVAVARVAGATTVALVGGF